MIFKEWFEMFYNAYCVDVIAYDCYKDYYYINQKHFGYIADMELTDVKPIDIQNCLKSTLTYSNERQRRAYFLLKRVFREAIVNGYCDKNPCDYVKPPNKLRHSYATYLIQCGADIETLRALLGHVYITTTQRYVHSNFNQMCKAVNNLKFE